MDTVYRALEPITDLITQNPNALLVYYFFLWMARALVLVALFYGIRYLLKRVFIPASKDDVTEGSPECLNFQLDPKFMAKSQ